MRGRGDAVCKGGRINTLVPGHRDLYKEAGITKQQTKAGSTRYNQQTPVQEHQARAEGASITRRKPPVEMGFDKQKMKELMDWMWRTRHEKYAGNNLSGDDKLWAPAGAIPRQIRPKMNQLMQYDWSLQNPYPGWVLAIDQGCAGWKCKLMTDEELSVYNTGVGKSRNPKSIKRTNEAGPHPRSKNAEAEVAKRKLIDPASSSCDKQDSTRK